MVEYSDSVDLTFTPRGGNSEGKKFGTLRKTGIINDKYHKEQGIIQETNLKTVRRCSVYRLFSLFFSFNFFV